MWTYVSGQHTFLVCSPMTHFIVIYCVFLHDLKIIPLYIVLLCVSIKPFHSHSHSHITPINVIYFRNKIILILNRILIN